MKAYRVKTGWLFVFLTLLFAFCLMRLAWIQLVEHRYLSLEAVGQRCQSLIVDCNHGKILDRNGVTLERHAEYIPWLAVFPALMNENGEHQVTALTGSLSQDEESRVKKLLEKGQPFLWPVELDDTALEQVLSAEVAGLLVVSARPAGLPIAPNSTGQYLAGHTLGFYHPERTYGLCQQFADYLKSPGPCRVALFCDARGDLLPQRTIYYSSYIESTRPYHVVTTIDRRWQQLVEQELTDWCSKRGYPFGSVVAVDAETGGMLAISSYPGLPEDWNNHALQAYAPGSVFKIVVAAAALCEGKVAPWDSFTCTGSFYVGNRTMHCWNRAGHGQQSLAEALANSCNSAFVELGCQLGNETIIRYARQLGLGRSLKHIYGDSSGHLPEVTSNLPFNPNYPIGQGEITTTPVQIANLIATIVNNGIEKPVYLVDRIVDNQGHTVRNLRPQGERRCLPRLVSYRLQDMLTLAVNEGTGTAARLGATEILGKTGSAENGTDTADCWFAGAVKIDGRWIVLVVHIGRGGSSAESAAPLFRSIVEKWLRQH